MKKRYVALVLISMFAVAVAWAAIETIDHGNITVGPDGDISSGGYITAKKSGVFAYIPASQSATETTITTAGTYYPVANIFTNQVMENFIFDTDHIEYSGAKTQYFEIDWHASVSADVNGTTIHVAMKKNSTVLSDQAMGHYCKYLDEVSSFSGTVVVELATDDEISIVCTSDGNGDKLNFIHFTTTITEFFD